MYAHNPGPEPVELPLQGLYLPVDIDVPVDAEQARQLIGHPLVALLDVDGVPSQPAPAAPLETPAPAEPTTTAAPELPAQAQ